MLRDTSQNIIFEDIMLCIMCAPTLLWDLSDRMGMIPLDIYNGTNVMYEIIRG
jgi:hypothetical protein